MCNNLKTLYSGVYITNSCKICDVTSCNRAFTRSYSHACTGDKDVCCCCQTWVARLLWIATGMIRIFIVVGVGDIVIVVAVYWYQCDLAAHGSQSTVLKKLELCIGPRGSKQPTDPPTYAPSSLLLDFLHNENRKSEK